MLPYEHGDLRQFLRAQLHPPLQRAWVSKCPTIPAQTPRLHHKNSPQHPVPPKPDAGHHSRAASRSAEKAVGAASPQNPAKILPGHSCRRTDPPGADLAQVSPDAWLGEATPAPDTCPGTYRSAGRGQKRPTSPPAAAGSPPCIYCPHPSSSSELHPSSAAPSSLRHRGGNSDRIMKSCTVYYKKAIRQTAGWGPAPVT